MGQSASGSSPCSDFLSVSLGADAGGSWGCPRTRASVSSRLRFRSGTIGCLLSPFDDLIAAAFLWSIEVGKFVR